MATDSNLLNIAKEPPLHLLELARPLNYTDLSGSKNVQAQIDANSDVDA